MRRTRTSKSAPRLDQHRRHHHGSQRRNIVYSSTMCAEQAAIYRALAEGHTHFDAIAIAGSSGTISPCGACRQVLAEFMDPSATVVYPAEDELLAVSLSELLPHRSAPHRRRSSCEGARPRRTTFGLLRRRSPSASPCATSPSRKRAKGPYCRQPGRPSQEAVPAATTTPLDRWTAAPAAARCSSRAGMGGRGFATLARRAEEERELGAVG